MTIKNNMAGRIKKLTVFDIFVILLAFVALVLIGIKFLTIKGLTLKGTVPVEVTFMATQIPNEIASKVKEGEELLVNNFYFGKATKVEVNPDYVEVTDYEGNLFKRESTIYSRVFITVKTEAVEGTNGYQRGNVKINIGETYNLFCGPVKLQGKAVGIKKVK